MFNLSLAATAFAAATILSAGTLPAFADNDANGIPLGPYRATCTDSKVSGEWLTAQCKADDGSMVAAKIRYKTCHYFIENHNGKLRCPRPM